MHVLNYLFAFSHQHCIAICAVLVPLNLLFTLLTLTLVGLNRFKLPLWSSIALAIASAVLMVLHVLTWFVVGVIQVPTFVLFSLGACCLALNLWALTHSQSLRKVILAIVYFVQQLFQSMVQRVEAS